MSTQREPGEVILELQRATHATLRELGTRLAALDLVASEVNTLANLTGGPLPVGALAAATATRPTTLTSVLDRLAARGYVSRAVDPADRRSFLVSLTADGLRAAAQVTATIGELEARALARVSEADVAGFRAVVRALAHIHDEQGGTP